MNAEKLYAFLREAILQRQAEGYTLVCDSIGSPDHKCCCGVSAALPEWLPHNLTYTSFSTLTRLGIDVDAVMNGFDGVEWDELIIKGQYTQGHFEVGRRLREEFKPIPMAEFMAARAVREAALLAGGS